MSTITLRSPEAAIASLPYLLGFTPQRSLITIGITADDLGAPRVSLVSRTDLPDTATDLQAYADAVTAPFTTTNPSTGVVFIIVDDTDPQAALADEGHPPRALLADELTERADQQFEEVLDFLYTDGQTYTSYLCQDTACPCANGAPVSQSIRDAVAAEFIASGVAPVGSRDDLAGEWTGPAHDAAYRTELTARLGALTEAHSHLSEPAAETQPAETQPEQETPSSDRPASDRPASDRPATAGLPADRLEQYALVGSTVTAMAAGTDTVDIAELLAQADRDIRIRDAFILHTAHLDPAGAQQVATIARHIASDLPTQWREAAAVLSTVGQYLAGDGARANVASDVVLATNPNSTMGHLAQSALASGLPPAAFAQTMRTLTPEQVMGLTPTQHTTPAQHPALLQDPAAATAPSRETTVPAAAH